VTSRAARACRRHRISAWSGKHACRKGQRGLRHRLMHSLGLGANGEPGLKEKKGPIEHCRPILISRRGYRREFFGPAPLQEDVQGGDVAVSVSLKQSAMTRSARPWTCVRPVVLQRHGFSA